MGKTFVEKVLGADCGAIVFRKPDIVLTHDNTASIKKTFEKMGGSKLANPAQSLVVLDHNAPPTNAKLATDYQSIRDFVDTQHISRFYDAGKGICHQLMSEHAKPGQIIVGSDSHTCTAGAFNALAAGIDRTEAAGIWKTGETWFRVPESIKIILHGKLKPFVYAKDISLWIIGRIGSSGANYQSIEYHGEGVKSLTISDRMTIANLASEMGAKNAVFPPDEVLEAFYNHPVNSVWSDADANYARIIEIDLSEIEPMVAVPHHVDNVKCIAEMVGTPVQQGFIGTCTNGRIEDLRIAAHILKSKQIKKGFQLLITPASQKIYLQALKEGLIEIFLNAGANILGSSCGPCLGTGQGIPANGVNVISTANRNFKGRMGNPEASIYLASPACVALAAIEGQIILPQQANPSAKFETDRKAESMVTIDENDLRLINNVWNYSDIDNLNTDQMFAGNLTYNVLSSDGEAILPHLFAGFDPAFSKNITSGQILVGGDNFGCGSSREHPAVGMAHAGIQAVIVKSVNRIFYRSAINQGLLLIVEPKIVKSYHPGDQIEIDLEKGLLYLNDQTYKLPVLPEKLMQIINNKGLVKYLASASA